MLLLNWNPDAPAHITPLEQRGVKAYFGPQDSHIPIGFVDPAVLLLMVFRNVRDNTEPPRTLTELVTMSPKSDLLTSHEKLEVLHLRVSRDGVGGHADGGGHFDFFLDPAFGFLVKRLVEHYPKYKWYDESGSTTTLPVKWVREVKHFADCGSGVFFPKETELRIYRSDRSGPTSVVRAVATKVLVNEPFPEDALNFRFPPNVLVQYPPVGGKNPVKLWGPNNQPIADITGFKDVLAHDPNYQQGNLRRSWPALRLTLVAANIALIVALAIWLLRKYYLGPQPQ
jgi:hypothetical protein